MAGIPTDFMAGTNDYESLRIPAAGSPALGMGKDVLGLESRQV
jgi:hypothetical protein